MARKSTKTSTVAIKALERSAMATDLRKAGATYPAIGERLGITPAAAYKAVMRYLANTVDDQRADIEALRAIELQRLDTMQFGIWRRVIEGDDKAISIALNIQTRRAALLGLDAPKKVEANIHVEVLSWNQAIKDFIDILVEANTMEDASERLERVTRLIDEKGQERFAAAI